MGEKVMFTAVADKGGYFGPFESDRPVIFENEIINVGDAYDSSSGIFKAPLSGYYYFSFFYHAGKERKSGLSLMKNSDVIVSAFDDTQQGPDATDNAANAACLQLQRGDKVCVRLHANCHVLASRKATSFSGFLISHI